MEIGRDQVIWESSEENKYSFPSNSFRVYLEDIQFRAMKPLSQETRGKSSFLKIYISFYSNFCNIRVTIWCCAVITLC